MGIFSKVKKKNEGNISAETNKFQSVSQNVAAPEANSKSSTAEAPATPAAPQTVAAAEKYELEDISYIRKLVHTESGGWQQYDVLLEARGYGWEDMKVWAEYMSKNDLDISQNSTLTVAPIIGAATKEIIDQYHSIGNITQLPALDREQGVLAMGGLSQKLKSPVKIVWMNQTRYLQLFTWVTDEMLMTRYIETVIRQTFGTPDEMKLAKPVQPGQ